jgi:hypothetical protein
MYGSGKKANSYYLLGKNGERVQSMAQTTGLNKTKREYVCRQVIGR